MAVDGSVVDIDVVAVGDVEKLVASLHDARPLGERFQSEFGDGELDILSAPPDLVRVRAGGGSSSASSSSCRRRIARMRAINRRCEKGFEI